jgi:tetratricopeptide (TPR) repeat protein
MRRLPTSQFILVVILTASSAFADGELALELRCGGLANLENAYGPFDYNNMQENKEKLPIVEKHHFTRNVEFLVKGETGRLIGDIDYTLRAFPNHPRALNAVGRLELRDGVKATLHPASCYFDRALKFRPNDANVYLVYGIYLYKANQLDAAIEKLTVAIHLAPDSAEAHYNLGLMLYANEEYEEAIKHATIAKDLGYPLGGLIKKLKRDGYWKSEGLEESAAANLSNSE